MVSKFNKICISGASGTGKTTLATYIAENYQLPYLNASSSRLWSNYGYKNHEDVHRDVYQHEDIALRLQNDILNSRNSLFSCKKYFVTDRGPIDQLAYFLNYFQISNPMKKVMFINLVRKQLRYFDAFIFIRFSNTVIEDNGLRILDPYYQLIIDSIMAMIIEKNLLDIKVDIITIPEWDWDTRTKLVDKFIKR
jgi:adenylate kinase family enzyme